MTFYQFYRSLSPEAKKKLAKKSGISLAYIRILAGGFRNYGIKSIRRLMKADKRITLRMFE